MSARAKARQLPPPELALPPEKVFRLLLERPPIVVPAEIPLYRAAWNEASILPQSVDRTYRFGPPPVTYDKRGNPPFHWIYLADHPMTAVIEARFTGTSPLHPGRFYIEPVASAQGLLATFIIPRELRLLELSGTTAALSGLHDVISSPDHLACQWVGWLLDRIAFAKHADFDGIHYPSRRRRGASAIALSSRRFDVLQSAGISKRRFRNSAVFRALQSDSLRIAAP